MPPPRENRNLTAAVVAALGCGGLSMLAAVTILSVARPTVIRAPVVVAVWAVAGLAAGAFCWRAGPRRQIWSRVALTTGFHALTLPVAALIAFGATGIWPPPETADLGLNLDLLGVRLVGTPTTVRIGVGGFVLGLILVAIGDRARGRRGTPDRVRRGTGRLSG